MSLSPGLGAFNKDKVANKFGIQLKGKDAPSRTTTEKKPTTPETPTVTKNKTIGDFRTDKNTNGFLSNLKPSEPAKKPMTKSPNSKSTTGLVNTSVNPKQQQQQLSSSLPSTNNHSTDKSKPAPATTKQPTVSKSDAQKDQPLSRRQSSKQLDHTTSTTTTTTTAGTSPPSQKPSATTTTTTTTMTTTSLKR